MNTTEPSKAMTPNHAVTATGIIPNPYGTGFAVQIENSCGGTVSTPIPFDKLCVISEASAFVLSGELGEASVSASASPQSSTATGSTH